MAVVTSYQFSLEKYQGKSTRYKCPSCGKGTFTRYIYNTKEYNNTERYLADEVGRCDREVNCGYHLTPREYFKANGGAPDTNVVFEPSYSSCASYKVFIPREILQKSRFGYDSNSFARYLSTLFDETTVAHLIAEYQLGSSTSKWPGACIFWFIDIAGRIHYGQVKLFENGHSVKEHTTSIGYVLKNRLKPLPAWVDEYNEQERKIGCLFGEHLLRKSHKPVAIVEAPATAVVASIYLPAFTWLAIGSLSYLTPSRCDVLKGRKVVLYPDLGGFKAWKEKGDALGFECSDILERFASPQDRERGLDLRDYLERRKSAVKEPATPVPAVGAINLRQPEYESFEVDGAGYPVHPLKCYPVSWDSKSLIEQFDCAEVSIDGHLINTDVVLNKPRSFPMMSVDDYRKNSWRLPTNYEAIQATRFESTQN